MRYCFNCPQYLMLEREFEVTKICVSNLVGVNTDIVCMSSQGQDYVLLMSEYALCGMGPVQVVVMAMKCSEELSQLRMYSIL